MATKSFSDILDNSPEELEPTLPLPPGEYEFQVKKATTEDALPFDFGDRAKGSEQLMIYATPVTAIEVDPEDLDQCDDWRDKLVSIRIFPDEFGDKFCDMKNERGFAYHCGIDPKDFIEAGVGAMIAATVGNTFGGTVVHGANKKDPDRPFVNLKQTFAL